MKYFYCILIFIFFVAGNLQAQQIVKDVNTVIASNGYKSSNITKMTVAGANTYFVANDASSGDEPWVTDGTAAGTHILRDINPGKSSSVAKDFTFSNGYVFFNATDGTHGYELWRTDGTAAGTVMVKDINPGFTTTGTPNSGGAIELCDVNGVLYFVANNDLSMQDEAIWKTDGTEAGTVFVNNINIESAGNTGSPVYLTNFNGLLYYVEAVNNQPALYRITGAGATELVLNINASNLTVIGSTMYFSGQTNANGAELWKTDGTTAGTVLVKDIYPGTQNSLPDLLTNVNGTLFFTAWDGVNGTELWKSDGTEAGTVMVKDITTADNTDNNSSTSKPTLLTNVNGTLFFSGYTVAANKELWKSDGTEAGTVLVKDIIPGSSFPGGNPVELINNNGTLLFIANDRELWKSDGTQAGTVLVQVFTNCQFLTTVTTMPGHVVFYAHVAGTNNIELWISNGIAAGTSMIKNIAVDNPSSLYSSGLVAQKFAHANGQLFFPAKNTSTTNHSLYSSYGTPATTVKLDGVAGSSSVFPSGAVNAGGYIYFAYSGAAGKELWKSDGTVAGTAMIKDIHPSLGSNPLNLFNLNGIVYFSANDGTNGNELWKTDGTTAGTVLVKDIYSGSSPSNPSQFTNFNGLLYFVAITAANGRELWKSDGTAAGTVLVKDIYPGTSNSLNDASANNGNYFTVVGNQLFFSAASSSTVGNELWKTDGTEAGTVLVKDIITTASQSSDPHFLTAVGNKLFFVADDYGFGTNDELWQSDGTTAGTVKIKEINAGNNPSSPSNLINLNGILYFSAFEPATGYELWKSDGTAVGTVLLKDIEPGVQSGMQAGKNVGVSGVPYYDITKANGLLYFPAATAANGRELWQSDGTAAGTIMVGDLFAGPQSSDAEQITNANGDIYFVAENGSSGKEVFTFKPNGFFVLPPITVQDSMDIDWQNILLANGTNQIIASIKQSGIKPLNGLVKTKLTVGAAAINYNGRTLARKHFDIEPINEAAIATATVTLYFSQADFTQYNSDDNINGDLPINPTDAAGKAALRIIQYHGVGTEPGNYPGAEEIINPSEDSIVWNATANYWEVSFTVTGFSGFYLSSVASSALPISFTLFNGKCEGTGTYINWQTAQEINSSHFKVQSSNDANNWTTIATITAAGNSSTEKNYSYVDNNSGSLSYYRIAAYDIDGSVKYTGIIKISCGTTDVFKVWPNPVTESVFINISTPKNSLATVKIFDGKGALITTQQSKLLPGNNQVTIAMSNLSAGIYQLIAEWDNGEIRKTISLIKH